MFLGWLCQQQQQQQQQEEEEEELEVARCHKPLLFVFVPVPFS